MFSLNLKELTAHLEDSEIHIQEFNNNIRVKYARRIQKMLQDIAWLIAKE